jgi:sugar lactone lactonase YvrE
VDRIVELPVTSPTCCCFGGDRLDTMYVVSSTHRHTARQRAMEPYSGGLLAIDVRVRGLPEAAFGG